MSSLLLMGVGGSVFSPSDVSGLILWLKSDSLSLNDDDPVGTWSDSSGQGNNASQATSTKKPLYKTNIINGRPVVRFDGSDDYLSMTSIDLSTAHSVFLVAKVRTGFGDGLLMGSDSGTGVWAPIISSTAITYRAAGTNPNAQVTTTLSADTWYLFEIIRNGTTVQIFLNATQVNGDKTLGANENSNITGIDGYGNGIINNVPLDTPEILVYNSAISSTNRQNVESYLNTRYAIY